MNKPTKPSSTDDQKTPLLEDIDQMSPEQLADYLYALAEEIIASPQEYKIKMGLEQLDISELDNVDISTPEGRKKLAKLFRLLAEQVLKGKEVYQATVVDKSSPDQSRGGRS
jgi:hypothetical protein